MRTTKGADLVMARDNDHALTVRLPAELHEQLVKRAEEEERTVAGLLRLAAKQYLKKPREA